ncbi:Cell wall-binding protein yocH precursor [Gemella morbillorum]|uniref:LysM peptidoglycan-binding domain-containing protein n=1 Tax=Gemella morbillorum TaxID=29391 RepID=UPI000DA3FF31|nr:LysM peptidoglycan-binding domain-containing protein [Gemella morbillorum]MDK8239593.1 LysM peptidoglycan-binding domain-containing protein [Gemella morbillorum]MDK8254411.1 LysM peptidoglycan-binding domain-containing protein [Gemella morbillorum]UBH80762.1 LysM peptidoglycan-binding domain-containing protein [Gemella morbillorum]SQH56165.1 Cell wall-binding protein yocH precursor [Gemella morbillorum]
MSKLHKLVATTAIVSTVAFGLAQVADADTYTVKKGDTLWDIAINNGTTVDQLMHDNNLTSSLIFPGDKLTYNTTVNQVAQAKQEGYYSVVLGDTLAKISSRFGVSVDELVKLNNISNPNLIYVGEVLRIDAAAAAKTQTTAATVAKASVTQTTSAQTVVKVDPTATVAAKPAATPAPAPAATPAPAAKPAATPAPAPAPKAEVKPAATPAPAATTQVASSNKAAAIYQAAMAQLGRIQDCTMLVTNSLKAVGINFHDWPAGYMSLGTVVPASQAQPGDLVYYANGGLGFAHIAVYAGNGQAIHGGWNGNQTVVNSVNVGSGPVFIRVR